MRNPPLRPCSLAASLAAILAGFSAVHAADPAADASLKWTPHRAAARPLDGGVEEALAAAAVAPQAQTMVAAPAPAAVSPPPQATAENKLPPAAVAVPDTIPAPPVAAQRQVVAQAQEQGFAPLRKQLDPSDMVERFGKWVADSQPAGSANAAARDAGPLGMGMMRTPQGHRYGRPMMAQERPVDLQDLARQRDGGGLAPPFNPNTVRRPARPERLAMDIDSVPSVMSRQAQAEAVAPPAGKPAMKPGAASRASEPLTIEGPSISEDFGGYVEEGYSMGDEMWMGRTPAELYVESFYDDPYACEEDCDVMPWHFCHGRVCNWLRQFGRPYYGWRWYRDLTASVGVTAFENEANLGLFGNFGFNEYVNWSMPFWNAFGIGWQLGVRGTQTSFGSSSIDNTTLRSRSRNQTFVTTGFFTRAFEGRGLQGGAVYDYLHDSFLDNVDLAQLRAEISYVWGYHEIGFWGAFNSQGATTLFDQINPTTKAESDTVHVYTGFYRMQFGDANEIKIWGGASEKGQGYIGSTCRAPMSRSLALEGTFAYLMPGRSESIPVTVDGQSRNATFTPMAWNLAINLVYYPASRSRRSLSSPYRPLFDVADNGTMMQAISRLSP